MYKGRVLIVDDLPDVRATLSGLLSDEGYEVRSASSSVEALKTLSAEHFHVAILDVRLDESDEDNQDGLLLMHEIEQNDSTVAIIILTGYADVKMVREVLQPDQEGGAPAFGFLEKSEMSQLPEYVKRGLEYTIQMRTDTSQLSLSLAINQPLRVRARGRHVCSVCTSSVLQVSVDSYAKSADIAGKDLANLRFQVKKIGSELWNDIFVKHPEAKEAYIEARAKDQLLSLLFEASGEFLGLPLEFMHSDKPSEYLVLQHPFARLVCDAFSKREALSPQMLMQTQKLRILIIASNTLPSIDGVDAEAMGLYKYLKRLKRQGFPLSAKFVPTKDVTYERIRAELKKPDYDIIHYAGHGSYNAASPEESCLYFWADENKQGGVVPMMASELKMLLGCSEARLVYLSSCYGTATGSEVTLLDDDFLGLADAVAQAGVPSVLGFRWPVSDEGAPKLAQAFYQSLLEQGSPEVALWEARCELAALDRNDPTWLSPILIHQV